MLDTRRQITRNRISYSCQNCRRRKIKCTKSQPSCEECLKTGEECVYDSRNHSLESLQDPANGHNLGKRKLGATHVPSNGKAPSTHSEPRSVEIDVALSRLEDIVAKSSFSTGQQEGAINQDHLTGISDRLNKLRNSISTLTEPDVGLDKTTSEPVIKAQTNTIRTACNSVPNGPSQDTIFQYSFVPCQKQSNVLFRNWLLSVYPILPIIDPTEALIKYEVFHQWHKHGCDRGVPNPVKSFMPMIFAIHYSGIVSMSMKGLQKWWPGIPRRMLLIVSLDHYMRSITSSKTLDKATLVSRVLMWHLCRDNVDDDLVGSSSVTSIIRDAQMLGLHRRSSHGGPTSNSECDCRLWWEIVNVDTSLASSSSLPPMINEHYFDTTLPSEVKDHLLGTLEIARYEEELRSGQIEASAADDPQTTAYTSVVSVHFMISRLRARLTSLTRRLTDLTLGVKKMTRKDLTQMQQILSALAAEIKAVMDRIPLSGTPEMNTGSVDTSNQILLVDYKDIYAERLTLAEVVCTLGDRPIAEPHLVPHIQQSKLATMAFHRWAHIYLSTQVDQIHSLSYGPFMRSLKSKMWLVARQCLLKHCHSFLRRYIVLATDPEIQCFRWAWMAMLQSMHSSLLLLLDLYERPDSPEAARSRALIDHMLSLGLTEQGIIGGDDGITSMQPLDECGREAKSLLLDLRTKAWQRAGLDPTILWTERDQIQVGAAKIPTNADLLARSMREDTIRETEVDSSASSREILRSQYRQIVLTVTGEVWHPSELGEPPDVADRLSFLQRINETAAHPRVSKLSRARQNQELAPSHRHEQWLRAPEGHVESLIEINQLLQKIKDAKKSNTGLSESAPERAEKNWSTPIKAIAPKAPPLAGGFGAYTKGQSSVNEDLISRQQPNIGLSPQNEREVILESGSGKAHNQTPLEDDLGLQPDNEFDWNHWDLIFSSLNDENLTDMMDIFDGHGQ